MIITIFISTIYLFSSLQSSAIIFRNISDICSFDHITSNDVIKMESVLAENEELRQAQLERLRQHQDNNLGPMGPLNAELLAEMNERVEVSNLSAFSNYFFSSHHYIPNVIVTFTILRF